jgi:hypothetical protein
MPEQKMSPDPDTSSVIIQIDRPGRKLAMAAVRKLLEGTGVEIDTDYGPIPINPAIGRYVVRGRASPAARAKAEKISGVRLFADTRVRPMQ